MEPDPLTPDAAMALATELAARGPAHGPNPRVGAVLTDDAGHVLGRGWHEGAGTPHAEVAAIADAAQQGNDLAGATAYVTLEPCSHTGRTGPCTDALTAAGVARVRYATADPNPVASHGAEILRGRGIDAQVQAWDAAAELNERWMLAVSRHRPYVIAKWAQSLDGRISANDGSSFWITGDDARQHAHVVRTQADAIVVGTGTVLADNPLLSARPGGVDAVHQPLRVVMGHRDTRNVAVWRDSNAVAMRTHDPHDVLAALDAREVRTVIVEGGSAILTAFVAAEVVDELNVYIAPTLLGSGTGAIGDLGIDTMSRALRAEQVHATSLGVDTLIVARLRHDNG